MTQTGMVKYVCKKINSPEALNQQRKITVETQKSIKPEIQKWIENEVFRGGFCVSVPCNSFCINDTYLYNKFFPNEVQSLIIHY